MSRRFRSFANRRICSLQAVVVFASLVLAIAPPVRADDAAEAIINKGINAIDGEATLAKAKATTSKVKGTFALVRLSDFPPASTTCSGELVNVQYQI